jgi:DnaJ-class molecular chaperone
VNKDYYQILGLKQNSTQEEIKKAYRLYASKFHPDKHEGDKFFEEKFKEIKEAYDILSDPENRKKYDDQHFGSFNSSFNASAKTNDKYSSRQNKHTAYSSNNKTSTKQPFTKPKTETQQRRQKNIFIGIGTTLAFVLLLEIGGNYGMHIPIAMFFLFWTIRQIWVVIVSFIPD